MSCRIEIDGKVYEGKWSVSVVDNKVYVDGEEVDAITGEAMKKVPNFWDWLKELIK